MKRDINDPAANAVYQKCNKKRSFQCTVLPAVTHTLTEDAVYLSTVDTATLNKLSSWCIPITLDNTKVMFKVGTGADVTVITQKIAGKVYKILGEAIKEIVWSSMSTS